MSLQKDGSGRRWVEAQTEVPGTPEQVWQAIATGEGVSSWFVPTEKRDDGTVVSHFGPGMDAVAKETAFEPPHRFAAESEMAPGVKLATEWIVETKSGGTCVVRVVHSLFTSLEDWDGHLENIEQGWASYFHILRLYLQHFAGAPCSAFQLMGFKPGSLDDAWRTLVDSLGLANAAVGQTIHTQADAPRLAGVVERGDDAGHGRQLLLRIDAPAPGLVHLFAMGMGEMSLVSLRFYWYGAGAPAAVAEHEPKWQAWLKQHYPPAGEATCSG